MKKNIVICMNCHGFQYYHALRRSPTIRKNYIIKNVCINKYVRLKFYKSKKNLVESDVNKLKEADILIIQYIQTDRGFLNHQNIIDNYINKDKCQIITLPHYRSSMCENLNGLSYGDFIVYQGIWRVPKHIYQIYFDVNKKYDEFVNKLTEINYEMCPKEKIDKIVETSLNEFQEIENKQSSVKIYDFISQNYDKYKFFGDRSHPRRIFFYFVAKLILELLNIHDMEHFIELEPDVEINWNDRHLPINEKALGFNFIIKDNEYTYGKTENEYFYNLCCELDKLNIKL